MMANCLLCFSIWLLLVAFWVAFATSDTQGNNLGPGLTRVWYLLDVLYNFGSLLLLFVFNTNRAVP